MHPDAARCRSVIHAAQGLAVDHSAVAVEVEKLLSSMTLAQKINEIHGLQPMPVEGFYLAGGDEDLGIPAYRMADGPRGARVGTATAFPVAIARGATFNPELEKIWCDFETEALFSLFQSYSWLSH